MFDEGIYMWIELIFRNAVCEPLQDFEIILLGYDFHQHYTTNLGALPQSKSVLVHELPNRL